MAKRQKASDWFFHFIKQCRNGEQCDEMYNLVHGFPTMYTGSWLPVPSTSHAYTLLCDKPECYELCERTWPEHRRDCVAWSDFVSEECHACSEHRERRCRVRVQDSDTRHEQKPFTDAPYMHPLITHDIMHCFSEPYDSQPRTNALCYGIEQLTFLTKALTKAWREKVCRNVVKRGSSNPTTNCRHHGFATTCARNANALHRDH